MGAPRASIPRKPSAGYLVFMLGHWSPSIYHYLWIKLMEVFDIPDFGYGYPILVGEAVRSGLVFFCNAEGSFPHWGEFVHPFTGLEPEEDQISHLVGAWSYVAMVVAAESLLVACCSQCRPTPYLLEVEDVLLS